MQSSKDNLIYVPAGVLIYEPQVNYKISKTQKPTVLFVTDYDAKVECLPGFAAGKKVFKVIYEGRQAFLLKNDVFPVMEGMNYDVKTNGSL